LRVLIDTHVALWWLADDDRLTRRAGDLLTDFANEVLLSAVVVWEVAIKRSLGKLDAPAPFADALVDAGALPLPITAEHAEATAALPWHHTDPFDRMLVAQATLEGAVLVSADERLRPYDVATEW
jgi:PIN domain nuclease of toxin-antitoxin system